MKASTGRRHAHLCLLVLSICCAGRDISLGDGLAADASRPSEDASRPREEAPSYDEPRVIEGLSSEGAKDDDPALSADLLLLYFNSQRDGGQGQEDIWLARRASPLASFSSPAPERALNSEQRETGLALSDDALSLWFSSDRDGGAGGLDVYLATRASLDESWRLARVTELSGSGDDLVSSLSADGRSLFLARRDDEDDDYDLFVAQRSGSDRVFSPPEPIVSLNTGDEESDAVWLGEERGLVFTRDEQLVLAPAYPRVSDALVPLATLNSDDDDRDAWFSRDLSYVIFSSDRSGAYRLYEARLRR